MKKQNREAREKHMTIYSQFLGWLIMTDLIAVVIVIIIILENGGP